MPDIESAKRMLPTISIVVPCFNEEAVLFDTLATLTGVLDRLLSIGKISPRSRIVFVDDGSRDRTWDIIEAWVGVGKPVVGVKLSRNCGHQNALLAGLASAKGDVVITIDADLQDDEAAIEKMIDAYLDGCEVVYGVRSNRDSDTWFKRTTAHGFYKLMDRLGVHTVFDHADYRLMTQRAIRYLQQFEEANMFLRGVVPLLGLRSAIVHYERRPRLAGESKYPLSKMLEFALNGITSFSVKPLRLITTLGFAVCLVCLLLSGWAISVRLMSTDAVPGWASTILPIYFLGGVQLFCLGVLGEYTGKIYLESKKRPRFFVERVTGQESESRTARRRPGISLHRRVRSQPTYADSRLEH